MNASDLTLANIFEGWDGYQTSLIRAISNLTPDQLRWRHSNNVRTLGELACHIAFARLDWFKFMDAPGIAAAISGIDRWETDDDGNRWIAVDTSGIVESAAELSEWLKTSWLAIEKTLSGWRVSDLDVVYAHRWNGETYANTRQWTVWRIMAHDIHHGGQIARILAEQNIDAFELRGLGGHIVMPPKMLSKESNNTAAT